MIYFTSDQHFGHDQVIGYCNRPFSNVATMDDFIINKWNETVKEDSDLVYVLGDFSFADSVRTKEIMSKLRGKKILIKGNHDHFTITKYLELGFTAVLNEAVITLNKNIIIKACHYPYSPSWWGRLFKWYDIRYLDRRPTREKDYWLVHGHVHTAWKVDLIRKMINIGVDQWSFKPVPVYRLIEIIEKSVICPV